MNNETEHYTRLKMQCEQTRKYEEWYIDIADIEAINQEMAYKCIVNG